MCFCDSLKYTGPEYSNSLEEIETGKVILTE